MVTRYKLMVDPTPAGWAYGFPKALPDEAVLKGGKEYDLYVDPKFDLSKWIVEEGYPEESLGYFRLYPQEITEQSSVGSDEGGVMGDLKFTTAGDYIYPGSDPQE
jgi:hypothetical protein